MLVRLTRRQIEQSSRPAYTEAARPRQASSQGSKKALIVLVLFIGAAIFAHRHSTDPITRQQGSFEDGTLVGCERCPEICSTSGR